MRLLDLEPELIRYLTTDGKPGHHRVATLAEAQGLWLLCPTCFAANGGPIGTHGIICWSRSRGVPDAASPGPGRWRLDGTGLADLTLNAEPPETRRSVKLTGAGCGAHFHITNGSIEPC